MHNLVSEHLSKTCLNLKKKSHEFNFTQHKIRIYVRINSLKNNQNLFLVIFPQINFKVLKYFTKSYIFLF